MAENNTNKKIKIRIENPALGVPITFLDKYNPEQFEILNANDCRKSDSVPAKPHGLIKDKEGKITLDSASVSEQTATNKQTITVYARIVIRKLLRHGCKTGNWQHQSL